MTIMEVEGNVREITSPFMEFFVKARSRLRGVERKVDHSLDSTVDKVVGVVQCSLKPLREAAKIAMPLRP